MTKKPIDITGKLPPVQVRKPWRQSLPEIHAKRIDKLIETHGRIEAAMDQLKAIRKEFREYAPKGREEFEMRHLQEQVAAVLVLLGCAEEKLYLMVPCEEFMSAEHLAERGVHETLRC